MEWDSVHLLLFSLNQLRHVSLSQSSRGEYIYTHTHAHVRTHKHIHIKTQHITRVCGVLHKARLT